ncbi:MAG: hypothetical protein EHM81_04645 [Chloroflexi bacterium]|nr:MAG: hypothetical protein EHM81_04645 [Chloroflexota bacterium]
MRWLERISDYIVIIFLLLSLSTSNAVVEKTWERVQILAEDHAFDFTTWTRDAVWIKITQAAIGSPRYFSAPAQHEAVKQYLRVVAEIEQTEYELDLIYADPAINDPQTASTALRQKLADLTKRQNALAPLSEATLEQQVSTVLNDLGLLDGGQPIPWVLYHVSPLPNNLIISPRDKIYQETSYQLEPGITVEQSDRLENTVSKNLNVSALVVPIGGLATYPTMIMRVTTLDWLSSTIAHEWIHLYLGQRPLGQNYGTNGELRTMNETTASIAGNEIGRIVLERYYPELAQRPPDSPQLVSHLTNPRQPEDTPPPFDYRAEMHTTRVNVDEMLAAGKIEAAEAYMEQRRLLFWQHGHPIRKLNQAYFAFYGAYADVPGGAAGEDPVGPAVRALREQSASLKEFLERIAQMSSFEELKAAAGQEKSY